MSTDTKAVAPYGAWKTTLNALERFAESVIPPRIDRTAFPGMEWNAATRLLGGFRFLGLIDEQGAPQPQLHALATRDVAVRQAALAKLLRERYAELFKLDLARVTPAHFTETLSAEYNAKGDTLEKATRFFVAAATYAGIPLSPLLVEKGRKPVNGAPRRRVVIPKPRVEKPQEASTPNGGATRMVRLQSGGTLTLTANVDFLALSADDRTFVFDVIDKLAKYEQPEAEE